MPTDDEITEIEELGAKKVSAVPKNANGTPWLMLKAAESVNNEGPGDTDGEYEVPATTDSHSDTDEAATIENLLTKQEETVTEALSLLHDYAIKGTCSEADLLQLQQFIDTIDPQTVEKARLNAKKRNALPSSAFAYIDAHGGRHLPIPDAAHVRDALARFDQTHFESESAKKKAYSKIIAKAKEFGIKTSASDAKEDGVSKSPGVPDSANPFINGVLGQAAQSKVAGPATIGVKKPVPPAKSKGGESPYIIPNEGGSGGSETLDNSLSTERKTKKKKVKKSQESKVEPTWKLTIIDSELPSTPSTSSTLSISNPLFTKETPPAPTPAETLDPGNSVWETYDGDTLDSIAKGLTATINAVKAMRNREEIEAVSGHAGDWVDTAQLNCALSDLQNALQLIAALAYHEAAAAKSADLPLLEAIYKAVQDHPSAEDEQLTTNTSKEDINMAEITKEELEALVAKTSKKQAQKIIKAERKAIAKKAAKQAKKAAKVVPNSANNDGDTTPGEMEGEVHGTHKANDLRAVPDSRKVVKGKSAKKAAVKKQIADLEALVLSTNEAVTKMASTPRSGGPVLDGIVRGNFLATEGRMSNEVTKANAEPAEITQLRKAVAEAKDPMEKDRLSRELSIAGLTYMHMTGQG